MASPALSKRFVLITLLVVLVAATAVMFLRVIANVDSEAPDRPADAAPRAARGRPGGGRWLPAPARVAGDAALPGQAEMIDQLEALGYVDGLRLALHDEVITVHVRNRAEAGVNFFTSGHAPEALLVDMDGQVLHSWRWTFEQAWPGRTTRDRLGHWRRARLLENGDILAIFEGKRLIKLDRDSNLIWSNPIGAHHDLEVQPNGDIYVLTRKARVIPRIDRRKPVLEDFISVLDPDGQEKRRISLIEALETSPFAQVWRDRTQRTGDVLHTNTLRVLDGRFADRAPWFAAGNVLISILELDVVAVVDLEQERFVKVWRGPYKKQHDPKFLDDGNLLLFDNRGREGRSSVMEIDPLTAEIRWRYEGSAEAPFYSETSGAAQRLPGGNTLITESDAGRAFEVTPEGEIVWEFFNPYRAGEEGEYIATLFEVVRFPEEYVAGWLGPAAARQ